MATDVATLPAPSPLQASLKPILLLIGIALAVAAGVTVVLWSRGPSYSMLFANLQPEDQAQIAQALDAAQIPYRVQGSGIEVPSEKLTDARLKLAGQGLPENGGGFAQMDKDPGFGVSQFMENARYQHALETELARTIASMRTVEAARVHLAQPRQSAFVRDQHSASASVFLQVKPGRRLDEGQVQAIVNLVASSIPDLQPNQVTVVDQQGHLLSSPASHDEYSLREQQFDMVNRLEDDYAQRVEALLTPLVGMGKVKAQVVAQMDMSSTEEAREQYKPESQVVRSEQLSEQYSHDGSANGGVPGALSNQPPAAGVASPPASSQDKTADGKPANPAKTVVATNEAANVNGGGSSGGDGSKSSTRNYEIDRTLDYTHSPAGRIKRLTVAVLLDNVRVTGKDGKVKEVPISADQLSHITQLVKDAVGYDESRGDSVNVVNDSFNNDVPVPDGPLEKTPLWENPMARDLAKIGSGLLVLLVLVLAVLRPMVRTLIGPPPPKTEVKVLPREDEKAADDTAQISADAQAAVAGPDGNTPALTVDKDEKLTHEEQVAQARALVAQDPKLVAQVVRGWVGDDE